MSIEEMYAFIRKNLTNAALQEMSLQIIAAHKSKNYNSLQSLSDYIFGQKSDNRQGNRLFLSLIKYFHPDRLNAMLKDIDTAYSEGNSAKLGFYKKLVTSEKKIGKTGAEKHPRRFTHDYSEEHEYGKHDFGYTEFTDYDADDFTTEIDEEMDFIKAVKSEVFGNLDLEFELTDLEMIDGELNLADYGITDLAGLEFCYNIISLNLSNNRIDDIPEIQYLTYLQELSLADNNISEIDCLRNLEHLQILDLSGNQINDIAILLELDSLEFVDVRNNPIREFSGIDALIKKGITVMHDF